MNSRTALIKRIHRKSRMAAITILHGGNQKLTLSVCLQNLISVLRNHFYFHFILFKFKLPHTNRKYVSQNLQIIEFPSIFNNFEQRRSLSGMRGILIYVDYIVIDVLDIFSVTAVTLQLLSVVFGLHQLSIILFAL